MKSFPSTFAITHNKVKSVTMGNTSWGPYTEEINVVDTGLSESIKLPPIYSQRRERFKNPQISLNLLGQSSLANNDESFSSEIQNQITTLQKEFDDYVNAVPEEKAKRQSDETAIGYLKQIKNLQAQLAEEVNNNLASAYLSDSVERRRRYENAFKIPTEALEAINKYRNIKKSGALEKKNVTISTGDGGKGENGEPGMEYAVEAISTSLFNPFYGVRADGFTNFTPKMTTDLKNHKVFDITGVDGKGNNEELDTKVVVGSNFSPDFTDCSIKTLVGLSMGLGNNDKKVSFKNSLGRGTFRYIDFMYCRDVGKISNNHLIVLRRFSHPVGDNIFRKTAAGKELPDKGHLVTWFGNEENKLEDICKYTMNSTWREQNSKIQDVQSNEDDNHIGSSIINLMNPGYVAGVAKGLWGGNNAILQWGANKFGLQATGSHENNSAVYYRDANRVWEPKNTIQSTHVYEGKIQFTHEFNLTFTYEIKHYDGISGKTAFLDLIGNVLAVCHNRGNFWGGSIRWCGAPRNSAGWKKMNSLLDAVEKGADGVINDLFGISSWEELGSWVKDMFSSAAEYASGLIEQATYSAKNGGLKAAGQKFAKGTLQVGMGMLKNKLGRPAMYAMDSLLSGAYVGPWHVTIGNPRNPILSIGNLILMNTEVQHYGPLGIDDFPTKLKVTCTLKHGRPRDATEIGSMYCMGQGNLLLQLNTKQFREYYNIYNAKEMADMGYVDETMENYIENTSAALVEMDDVNSTWANT